MKITFIRPKWRYALRRAMEPLVLYPDRPDASRCETVLFDERLEAIPYDEPTGLVALTVETYNARRAYQIATGFRQRGVPVVMGGYHPTFMPEEAAQFADAVVIGDAEGLWPQIVRDVQAGKLKRIYRQPIIRVERLRTRSSYFRGSAMPGGAGPIWTRLPFCL